MALAHPFLQRLAKGLVLSDGAMGTMIYARGISFDHCFEELNISNPDLVQEIHLSYIRAGSELIETNTFGSNSIRLASYGLESKAKEFALRAAKTAKYARDISGEPVFIAGSIGPLGKPLRPVGKITPEQARSAFREEAEGLLEGGVDCFIIETFYDLVELSEAVSAVKDVADLPVIAQMTFNEDGKTPRGHTVEDVVEALSELGVDVIGANCSVGPQGMLDVIRRMRELTDLPISAHPNAGMPRIIQDRYIYLCSPAYMAEYAVAFAEAGAQVIGGCCGTAPEHIKAIKEALTKLQTPLESVKEAHREVVELVGEEEVLAPPAEQDSRLAQLLEEGRFVISVEVDPPKGTNPRKDIEGAAALKAVGADVINVADSPMARVRMSCLAMAYLIQEEVGIETIIHFTTRDRNLMGLQSDLLGAHAVGVRNILALTGDPPRIGDCPGATAVFDVDSVGLIHILKSLNEAKDLSGHAIGEPTRFFIICAVNPAAPDLEVELEKYRRKIEAGAELAMTQPLYELPTLERFLEGCETKGLKIPVLLGVLPLMSFRHASFLHNEVPGIDIPDDLRSRLQKAGDQGRKVGMELAIEYLQEAKSLVQGTYLMPSFGRYEVVAEVVRVLRQS
jgi:methionine synthase I (cobalamin-dependent)/5,10-methylenetetrahydrofolate reductase